MNDPVEAPRTRLVWDLPVRLMHWGLVVAVAGAWLSQELEGDYFVWHVRCGYAVLVIAVVRIAWGFVGTRHARFAEFVRGPRSVLAYIKSLVSNGDEQYVGHNPLGALAVLLMLSLLLAQAATGLFANDEIFNTGPLFGYVTLDRSNQLTGLHEQLFDALIVVLAIHVLAAFAYLWWKRQNLIWPMMTGRKAAHVVPEESAITESRLVLWLVLLALAAGGLYWVVRAAPEASLGLL